MHGKGIFVFVFISCGFWALASGIKMGAEGWNALSWPVAKGRMISSSISEYRTVKNIRVARLCLKLDYLYMVDEEILEGTRLDTGWRCFASDESIEKVIKKYPAGKELKVYYNPQKINQAVLEPGIPWPSYLLVGAAMIIFSTVWPLIRRILIRQHK